MIPALNDLLVRFCGRCWLYGIALSFGGSRSFALSSQRGNRFLPILVSLCMSSGAATFNRNSDNLMK